VAARTRGPSDGCGRTDSSLECRVARHSSVRLTEHLALAEILPSIGTVGDAFGNALMETINGLYKAERVRTTVFHDGPYKTIADVEDATE
jgi:putative transposase